MWWNGYTHLIQPPRISAPNWDKKLPFWFDFTTAVSACLQIDCWDSCVVQFSLLHNYFWGWDELNFRTQTYFLVWNGCSKLKNKFEVVFWMAINMIYPHINDNISTKYSNILVCYAIIDFQHSNALIWTKKESFQT